jgi:hypothetical protein
MAGYVDRAVSAFVRDIERQRNVAGQILDRTSIAQRFL